MTTKEKVLFLLEKNKGIYLSGTAMAKELEVSRNAVWKAIKQLEKEGFKIHAVTNKGYSLSNRNDKISVSGIMSYLDESTELEAIYYHDSIDSTNKEAKTLAMNGAKHGTVVVANEQVAGKGRYGRTFESPNDTGIYMSVIFKPEKLPFTTPTLITAFAAVEVCRTIEELTGKQVGIKWVNDIFLNNKKICGILTEAVTNFETGQIEWIVVGIGINMTTQEEDFSEDVTKVATSLFNGSDASVTRNEFIGTLLTYLINVGDEENMIHLYKQKSIVLNQSIDVLQGGTVYPAIAKDIDETGRLIVEKENGERHILTSGEVRIKLG
ncbi:MAG: biotin--[acetyl-CoA-carboxylase] ligase [Vagococcus sp.]